MTSVAAHQPQTTTTDKTDHTKRARADTFPLNAEFLKTMINVKAETVHPSSGIIYICKREDKLVEVWKGLIKYGFWSCPVLQKTKNKWYGFIDLMDILECVLQTFGPRLKADEDFWDQMAKEEIFANKTVGDVMQYPLSRKNPFHPVTKGYSLFSAIEILAREGVHRIPVVDQDRKLVNMLAQSQIITWINNNIGTLGAFKDKPLRTLPSAHKVVAKVNENELAIEAFKVMHYMDITGVAVVDDSGKLVGAISHSDLKLIQTDARMFWRLNQTVKNFLQKSRKEGYERPNRPITADANETIQSALKKFQDNHVHRIFIVDDANKPIGIVSLKDMLTALIEGY